MSREEGSGVPGPQAAGRTAFPDRTRVQPDSAPDLSLLNPGIVRENTRRTRAGVIGAELRDRGKVEADQYMAWKRGGSLSPSEYGVGTGGNSERSSVRHGAPDDAPNGIEDAPDKFGDASDSSNKAADGSNVAANGFDDVPDRYYDVPGSSNNAADRSNDQVTASFVVLCAHGGIDVDKHVPALDSPPTSVSEDTNTLTTSLSGP
ncbi:hypothetical protein LA080_013005 [Diaporthe eres]|nr:hypothetical protein LA080_013005 [Diaporthe eres]